MSLRDFYKSHYEREMVRKTDLTSALSVPVGVISLLVGALVLMAKELHLPLNATDEFLLWAIIASAAACLLSTYFLIMSLYNFAYGYIATPVEIVEYRAKLAAYHEATGLTAVDARKLAEEETLEYIDSEYAKYADRNARNNDIKSTFLHQANGAMIAAVLCGAVAGAGYVKNSLATTPPPTKTEISNLKEIGQVFQAQQAASTTPPPPPPKRPDPPPGRIIREDQRPPKPPAPPPAR